MHVKMKGGKSRKNKGKQGTQKRKARKKQRREGKQTNNTRKACEHVKRVSKGAQTNTRQVI